MQHLSFRYTPTVDDLIAAAALAPVRRRRQVRALTAAGVSLVATLVLTVLWGGPRPSATHTWITAVCAAMFVGSAVSTVIYTSRSGLNRAAHKTWKNNPQLHAECEQVVAPEGLISYTAEITQTVAWSWFGRLSETADHFILFDRKNAPAALLPKRALADSALVAVCRHFLTEQIPSARRPGLTVTIDGSRGIGDSGIPPVGRAVLMTSAAILRE